MSKSKFYNNIKNGEEVLPLPQIIDYFGKTFKNTDYSMLYGLYQGLINYKGISNDLLYNCFITNRLDELIHKKYSFHKSRYYEEFCDSNYKIGDTYCSFDEDEHEKEIIYTDDFCSTCNTEGYYTKNNYIMDNSPDCYYCGKLICNLCKINNSVTIDGEIENRYNCKGCDFKNPNMLTAIKIKISSYKWQDVNKGRGEGNVTIDDVFQLLKIQNFKCYVCGDDVKTSNWKPNCLYQITLDRIDETKPHNRDNVLICCLYCNCRDMYMALECNENKMKKICDKRCHYNERINIRSRRDVSKEEIISIKLI